jgi:O-antigen/teichoic acid export membrane protein
MSENSPLKTYGWQIAKAAISFGVVVVYSRYLGASGRGQMSILLLYLQVSLMFGELFAGSAMANWLVKYKPAEILPWVAAFSLGVLIISGGLIHLLCHISWALLIPLLVQGLSLAWLNIQYNIYQSQGWIGRRNKLQVALEGLKLLSLLLVAILIPAQDVISLNIQSMLEVLATVTFGILCFSFFKTMNIWKSAFPVLQPPQGVFFEGLWAQLGHFMLFLVMKSPLWFIAYLLGDSEAGVFANALLIADTVWIFSGSFGTVIHSRVLRNSSKVFHERLIRRYIDFSLLGTLLICVVVVAIPNGIFTMVFGENFAMLKMEFVWLIPGIIFSAMSTAIGNYLHAMNRFKALFKNHFMAFATLIVVILIGNQLGFGLNSVIISMNFALLVLLISNLISINWLFKSRLQLGFNILLIKRLAMMKWYNKF